MENSMHLYQYSRWDGSQQLDPFTAEDLMEHLADRILDERDLSSAMREMLQRGANLPNGQRMNGMRDLLERLRQRREDRLGQYNLGSIMDDIKEKLEQVLETERAGIQKRMDQNQLPRGEDSAASSPPAA